MNKWWDILRWMWAVLLMVVGASRVARRKLQSHGAIVVLAFHRVLEDVDIRVTHSLPGMIMRRRTFKDLCSYVTRRLELVSLSASLPGEQSHKLRMAFTFDDGWIDNYSVVFPIVREYAVPITVFVCPSLVDRQMPFWPERVAVSIRTAIPGVLEREVETAINWLKNGPVAIRERALETLPAPDKSPDRTMGWAEIEEMDRAGVTIGSHTQTHQILTAIPEQRGWREIVTSKTCLDAKLKKDCDQFAYPNGNHSAETRRLLAEAGFNRAFTMGRSAWTGDFNDLEIPRVNVAESDVTGPTRHFSAAMFEYTVFWKVLRATRI